MTGKSVLVELFENVFVLMILDRCHGHVLLVEDQWLMLSYHVIWIHLEDNVVLGVMMGQSLAVSKWHLVVKTLAFLNLRGLLKSNRLRL